MGKKNTMIRNKTGRSEMKPYLKALIRVYAQMFLTAGICGGICLLFKCDFDMGCAAFVFTAACVTDIYIDKYKEEE